MKTSHFPVEAPPCLWETFLDQPVGRLGSSVIGPLALDPGPESDTTEGGGPVDGGPGPRDEGG